MKEHGPVRFRFSGDLKLARSYASLGRKFLGMAKKRMGDDKAYWVRVLPDKVRIVVSSHGGVDQISIDAPTEEFDSDQCLTGGFFASIYTDEATNGLNADDEPITNPSEEWPGVKFGSALIDGDLVEKGLKFAPNGTQSQPTLVMDWVSKDFPCAITWKADHLDFTSAGKIEHRYWLKPDGSYIWYGNSEYCRAITTFGTGNSTLVGACIRTISDQQYLYIVCADNDVVTGNGALEIWRREWDGTPYDNENGYDPVTEKRGWEYVNETRILVTDHSYPTDVRFSTGAYFNGDGDRFVISPIRYYEGAFPPGGYLEVIISSTGSLSIDDSNIIDWDTEEVMKAEEDENKIEGWAGLYGYPQTSSTETCPENPHDVELRDPREYTCSFWSTSLGNYYADIGESNLWRFYNAATSKIAADYDYYTGELHTITRHGLDRDTWLNTETIRGRCAGGVDWTNEEVQCDIYCTLWREWSTDTITFDTSKQFTGDWEVGFSTSYGFSWKAMKQFDDRLFVDHYYRGNGTNTYYWVASGTCGNLGSPGTSTAPDVIFDQNNIYPTTQLHEFIVHLDMRFKHYIKVVCENTQLGGGADDTGTYTLDINNQYQEVVNHKASLDIGTNPAFIDGFPIGQNKVAGDASPWALSLQTYSGSTEVYGNITALSRPGELFVILPEFTPQPVETEYALGPIVSTLPENLRFWHSKYGFNLMKKLGYSSSVGTSPRLVNPIIV
ncbi:MAG: hypothetical protein KJO69_08190 [Gammaproteobacteria bacterium]|nr:hypothetical protein [Gammaproteobacteria bacterium]